MIAVADGCLPSYYGASPGEEGSDYTMRVVRPRSGQNEHLALSGRVTPEYRRKGKLFETGNIVSAHSSYCEFKEVKTLRVGRITRPKEPRAITVKRILYPVRVKSHNLDIRSLDPEEDGVVMFGRYHGRELPIRVDKKGRLEVVVTTNLSPGYGFHEERFANVQVLPSFVALPPQDTSIATVYSYAVINPGSDPIDVQVEISPDRENFIFDSLLTCLGHSGIVVVPNRFLKFTRLSVKLSASPVDSGVGLPSSVSVIFQCQVLR